MRKLILAGAGVACLGLAACADTADTFPLNDQARQMGVLKIQLTRTGLGFAPVTATLGDGEVLHGTARPAFSGGVATGFAVGPRGQMSSSTGVAVGDGNLQMTLNGPKTQLLCIGTVSAFGRGSGECRTYEGAAWTVSF